MTYYQRICTSHGGIFDCRIRTDGSGNLTEPSEERLNPEAELGKESYGNRPCRDPLPPGVNELSAIM